MGKLWQTTTTFLNTTILGSVAALSLAPASIAQTNLPICTSPVAGEFLVLVFTPSQPLRDEVQRQVGRTLPQSHDLLVCEYGGNVLSRIGGFSSQQQATEWAEYFDSAVGLPSMVITPVAGAEMATSTMVEPAVMPVSDVVLPTEEVVQAETFQSQLKPEREIPVASLSTSSAQSSALSVEAFQPQVLTGKGYGILVDYGVNPAVATQLKALLERDVALVVYAAHGYLLVEQTEDSGRVTALLNELNQNNFLAIAVPANQIILLKSNINP